MKKILSIVLLFSLLATVITPMAFAEEVTETIYSEDFESGAFTVTSNASNTIKTIYKDGVTTNLSYAKINGQAFLDSFPSEVVSVGTAANNTTNILSAGGYTFSGVATDALLVNFPKKTHGVLTIKYSVARPASTNNKVWMIPLSDGLNTDNSLSDYVYYTEVYRSSSATRFRKNTNAYIDANTKTSGSYQDRSGISGFIDYVLTIDIDNKKVTNTYRTWSEDNNLNWYANGEAGSYYMADGVSSMAFTANDVVLVDNIEITHTYTKSEETPKDEIEGLAITADAGASSTATFNWVAGDAPSKTARIITAIYNNDKMLIGIKSSADVTVTEADPTKTLTTDAISIPTGAKYIKAFVWDFESFSPYATTEIVLN
ncbi:MAG: hypothetical protein PHE51_01770 [Eubacteriales bacterium]|nr:hypothetical protein [Eubacteriales bacterium]